MSLLLLLPSISLPSLAPFGNLLFSHLLDRGLRHVRDRRQPLVRLQRKSEGGPERRLVEGGEGGPRRVGLELRDGGGAEDRGSSRARAAAAAAAAVGAVARRLPRWLSRSFLLPFFGPGAPVHPLERVRELVAEAQPERGGVVGLEGGWEEQGELVLSFFVEVETERVLKREREFSRERERKRKGKE